MAAVADEANAYLSDAHSELQHTKGLLNTTINERDEALWAVHDCNLAVSRDTHIVRMQRLNSEALVKKVREVYNELYS